MQPERKQQLDDQWLDALLTQAYQPDKHADARIAAVMHRLEQPLEDAAIDTAGQLKTVVKSTSVSTRSHWYSLRNLTALAIAASLLLLATMLFDNTQQRAYAAVVRSSRPSPQIRHYALTMINRRPGMSDRTVEADLYFDPEHRFVMKSPAMFGFGTLWVGGDTQQRWVAPPRGPVYVGGEESVGRWLTVNDIASPYLHLNTVLDRMANAYRLTMLPDETIVQADGTSVTCSHIRGDIRSLRPFLPRSIELWADVETGLAQRVIVDWPANRNRRGPVHWTIELRSTPDNLPSDWFDIAGHAAGRKIVRARTDRDLNVE